jgi:hypothetical protein
MINADDGSFVKFGMLTSGGPLFYENDFGSGGPTPPTGVWVWIVGSKAAGASIPRWHVQNVTTGGAWTDANGTATVNDLSGAATEIIVGGQSFSGGAGTTWRGSMAVLATWASVLSDTQVHSACTLLASDLIAASPNWMVRLNQASTATSVTDDTGGGGNQTSLSGTSVDSDVPPGFNFSLTTSGAFPSGLAIPVALGQPSVAIPSASPTGLAIPAAIGQPSVALARVANPLGLAIPVAIGQPSTVAPLATDSPGPVLVATSGRTAIRAHSGGQPIVASTQARAVAR